MADDTPKNSASQKQIAPFSQADFDAGKIYGSIIRQVLNMRSYKKFAAGDDPSKPPENMFAAGGESVTNAFFRMVGLPAIRNPISKSDQQVAADRESQYGTINLFGVDAFGDGKEVLKKITVREQSARPDTTQTIPITNNNIFRGRQFMMVPLPIYEEKETNGDRKPSIFPMVVAGDVSVWPLNRRLAPIGSQGDTIITPGGDPLQRTLIENVILLRRRGKNMATDEITKQLVKDLVRSINDRISTIDGAEGSPELEVAKTTGVPAVILSLVNGLLKAMEYCARDYAKVTDRVTKLMGQVLYVPALRYGADPTSLMGTFDVTYQQVVDATKEKQRPIKLEEKPSYDKNLDDINAKIQLSKAVYTMAPDGTDAPGSTSTPANKVPTQPRSDVFIADLMEVAASNGNALRQELDKQNLLVSQGKQELEKNRSLIQIYSGEITGISLFEMFAVFLGIYMLEEKYLFGLLNEQAKDRLKNNGITPPSPAPPPPPKAGDTAPPPPPPPPPTMAESQAALEKTVRIYLSWAQSMYADQTNNIRRKEAFQNAKLDKAETVAVA